MTAYAIVAFGCRARGISAIRARSSGRDATASPPVTPVTPPSAGHRVQLPLHAQHAQVQLRRTPRRPRTGSSLSSAAQHQQQNQQQRLLSSPTGVGSSANTTRFIAQAHCPPYGSGSLGDQLRSESTGDELQVDLNALEKEWLAAAHRADILKLTSLVRNGFDDIGASYRETGTSALHIVSALAREDCICAIFELARGVGGAFAHYGHRDSYARQVLNQTDFSGRNALHYAACASDAMGDGYISATIKRLLLLGVPLLQDQEGLTPLRLAHMLGNSAAEMALLQLTRAAGA